MKALINLLLSAVFGALVWFVAHSILLPVTDPSDSEGHGPDAGTNEWNHAVQFQTQYYERRVLYSGLIAGALAFAILSIKDARGTTSMQADGE